MFKVTIVKCLGWLLRGVEERKKKSMEETNGWGGGENNSNSAIDVGSGGRGAKGRQHTGPAYQKRTTKHKLKQQQQQQQQH